MMNRLFKEPLLHFLLLGSLLFALYGWVNPGASAGKDEILLSAAQKESLQIQFARTWQRPPTAEESQGLVDAWVREEVLYREGVAMGLDRDDPVVRRRITQKISSLADGMVVTDVTDVQLQAWLDAHAEVYRVEPVFALRQVYFDPQQHGARMEAVVAAARAALARGKAVSGDATLLPAEVAAAPEFEVRRVFGAEFTAQLATLPIGTWQGPIRSGFGMHLVQLKARQDGRKPALTEVRAAVERDLLGARSTEASEAFYKKLRARYTVRIAAPQ